MTDRIRRLTVVLDRDYRDDDVESLVDAIRMIRGVAEVRTNVVDTADYYALMAVRHRVRRELHEVIDRVLDGEEKTR